MTALAEQILQTILRIILKKTVCELLLLSDIDSSFLRSPVGVGEYTAVVTVVKRKNYTQNYTKKIFMTQIITMV